MAKKDPTIKERLASIEAIVERVERGFFNHLEHHWAFSLAILSAVAVEAVALVVIVLRHVL